MPLCRQCSAYVMASVFVQFAERNFSACVSVWVGRNTINKQTNKQINKRKYHKFKKDCLQRIYILTVDAPQGVDFKGSIKEWLLSGEVSSCMCPHWSIIRA